MRKQIAAANWKMNLDETAAQDLLNAILSNLPTLSDNQQVIFSVPAIYIPQSVAQLKAYPNTHIAAQNCHQETKGAYTGEIAASMYASVGVKHIVIGHSERRAYNGETDSLLAEKINAVLAINSTPLFCCGESLDIRTTGTQNEFVESQIKNALFHLSREQIIQIIIAYEPIWAIGTGQTASSDQAQEMHAHIRSVIAKKYGVDIADQISILYGGSVKASNAVELFSKPDVDGGLVGGSSLIASEFIAIINALQ